MSQYFIAQLATKTNIRVELNAFVDEVQGEEHLEAITLCRQTGPDHTETERRTTDSLFVFIGADAKTDWLPEAIAYDERGYLVTGLEA